MSDSLIYIILFALLMFFMHRGHGGMGGCGGHSHQHSPEKADLEGDESVENSSSEHRHHH